MEKNLKFIRSTGIKYSIKTYIRQLEHSKRYKNAHPNPYLKGIIKGQETILSVLGINIENIRKKVLK